MRFTRLDVSPICFFVVKQVAFEVPAVVPKLIEGGNAVAQQVGNEAVCAEVGADINEGATTGTEEYWRQADLRFTGTQEAEKGDLEPVVTG